ncbi:MAG: homoserine dehydrogenase [Oscillospiraceae bacterium]|nr:homoserine dehydrogenase [Oscillospiraceae bacterium]MDD3833384.1 homoserine dehydrogenase [Oscillospiraceae bacterium]MDD4546286.1 homoserine dehydrogenase [Oscillospiraceae bacterium]
MVKIAIMGYGVVGSGVVEVMLKNKKSISHKAGEQIEISRILDIREFSDSPMAGRFTSNFEDIINDPEIKIVVETIGGLNPAYDFVRRCLLAGKSVVTSNKELVAAKGDELLALARDRNLNFLFEASVGGGIPILRPLDQCLAANEVFEIAGILNGTTNFILTKMIRDNISFADALNLAQRLGYAERDPLADIGGLDACRKICILASLAFGKHVYPEQVHTQGIQDITLEDVKYADIWGGVIKLIGRARKLEDGRLDCIVVPMILPHASRLAQVNDVFNGILVRGDAIGDVVFYGQGAGKLPTASAVVADIIDEVKHLGARKYLIWESGEPDYVADYLESKSAMMLRLKCDNSQAVKSKLDNMLGVCERVDIENSPSDELVLVTPLITQNRLDEVLKSLSDTSLISRIRIADF